VILNRIKRLCISFAKPERKLTAAGLVVSALAVATYQPPAKAILTYSIFQEGGDVIVTTSGSLILPDLAYAGAANTF